jgi:hypothetical protein
VPNPNAQHPEVNYSGGQYDDPTENEEHYYDQEPYAHVEELNNNDLPSDYDVIEDHNNKEDYYPLNDDYNYDYPDYGSHQYHALEDIDKLDEKEYPQNGLYYPDKTYKPNDDKEPQFPSIDSEQYWTLDKSPESSYQTVNEGPYEDLEDFCYRYCAGQHPDNWCPIPHYSCLDTCLIPEDHPYYLNNVPMDVTCPVEGQYHPYSYWA